MMKLQLKDWILAAMFAALIAILAQVSIPIPISPVPLTGQTLAIGLAATILNKKTATLAATLYLLLGAIGMPVFSQFTSGIGIILGPTGGYLVSFILVSFLISLYLEKTSYSITQALIINHGAMIITLAIGTAWLKFASSLSWATAIAWGMTPFLIGGVAKAILSAWLGIKIRERLQAGRLL